MQQILPWAKEKILHVLDYSCSCCWAECLAGSNSYANCGFYSLFPPSSSFSHLSFFRSRSFTLFPPDIESFLHCEQIQLCIHIVVTRGKVVLSLSRLPSLCCDNEKRRFILMEFHADGTIVQEPKGRPDVKFGQMLNRCFQLLLCS